MINDKLMVVLAAVTLLSACGGESCGDCGGGEVQSSWDDAKASSAPTLALTDEFETPQRLSIATLGWEDGLNISRDGLHLYATYIPADFLSFVLSGDSTEELQYYARGPHYDMDFDTNPTGEDYPWYQSDIIYATRTSVDEDFSDWTTAAMKRSSFSEGAVSTVFNESGASIDMLVFTSNEEYTAQNNFKVIRDTTADPSGTGEFITSTDTSGSTSINTNYIEDNPHIERLDDNHLLLFFDSEDRPNGLGSHDIWYAESWDDGESWTTPVNVTSVNTTSKEHQPHLYHDGSVWWLYFSAYDNDDLLAIYRAQQQTSDDWDSWGTPELVMSAGNSAGIGEPTLTDAGELCFVVVTENTEGTDYDRYDSDPWCAASK